MSFLLSLLVSVYILQTTSAWNPEQFLKSLKEYEIVYPKVLFRSKRSISEDDENYSVSVLIKNWKLITKINSRLTLSPNFAIQYINSDSELEKENEDLQIPDCEILQGHVEGLKDSRVILTICDNNFYGMIRIMRKTYICQSLEDGRHVIYEENDDKSTFFANKRSFDNQFPGLKSRPAALKKDKKLNETVCYMTEVNAFGKRRQIVIPEVCFSNVIHDTLEEGESHHNRKKKLRYDNSDAKEGKIKKVMPNRNKRSDSILSVDGEWLDLSKDEFIDPKGLPKFFAIKKDMMNSFCRDRDFFKTAFQKEKIRKICTGIIRKRKESTYGRPRRQSDDDNSVYDKCLSGSDYFISNRLMDEDKIDESCRWFRDSTNVSDIIYTDPPEVEDATTSETTIEIDGYQTIYDFSGEDYEHEPTLSNPGGDHGFPTAYDFMEVTEFPTTPETTTQMNLYPTSYDFSDEDVGHGSTLSTPDGYPITPGISNLTSSEIPDEDHGLPPAYDFTEVTVIPTTPETTTEIDEYQTIYDYSGEDYGHGPTLSTPDGYPITPSKIPDGDHGFPTAYDFPEAPTTTEFSPYPTSYDFSGEDYGDGPTLSTPDEYQTAPGVPNLTSAIPGGDHGLPSAYDFTEVTVIPTTSETTTEIDEYQTIYDYSGEDYGHGPTLTTPDGYPITPSKIPDGNHGFPTAYDFSDAQATTEINPYPTSYDFSGEDYENGPTLSTSDEYQTAPEVPSLTSAIPGGDHGIQTEYDFTTEPTPQPPLSPPPQIPELKLWYTFCIAVDYTVVQFHSEERVWPYFLNLLNMVTEIVMDPTLDSRFAISISKFIILRSRHQGRVTPANKEASLKAVNNWNKQIISQSKEATTIWYTQHTLGDSYSAQYTGSVCDIRQSCGIVQDLGFRSVHITSHAIGHILGFSHDGSTQDLNYCDPSSTIMGPRLNVLEQNHIWSECSRRECKTYDKRGLYSCMKIKPADVVLGLPHDKNALVLTLDYQCRISFGDDYVFCAKERFDPCQELWCKLKGTRDCETRHQRPMDGTICEINHQCYRGHCDLQLR